MAKKLAAIALTAANLAALAYIVAAGEGGTFAPLAEVRQLADHKPALVEINEGATDDNGNVAVRATAEGISHSATNDTTETASAPAAKSSFEVMGVPADIMQAAKERRRSSRGAGEKYPFDSLEVGKGFFVAATEKMPEPAKSLASTVSSAIARYTVEAKDETGFVIMETVTVKDYQLGEDGKRVKDADGHWIVTGERKERRAKTEATRQFRIVPVDADIEKGTPAGVWIVRTA